jgi:RHS repeat-associated protein
LLAVDEVQTDGSKVTSYLMADRQGSTRVLMDAAGAVTSRHDYLPFGEELGAGTGAPGSPTGMRTAAQGYSAADNVRQRYAETRLDDATGLDHTLWRKLETRSGRWTTPDPYGGSVNVANPQSFNRYTYVHNDPVKFVDPSGLNLAFSGIGGGGYCWFISKLIDDKWQLVDGYCADTGGGDPSPTGGGGPDSDPTDLLKKEKAFGDADTVLLQDKKCRNFFTKGRSLDEVRDILRELRETTTIDNTPRYTGIAGTSGQGRAARITLYQPFFANDGTTRQGVDAGYHWNPSSGRYEELFTGLTPRQYRALIVLHEFAHALGLIPQDRPSVDPTGKTSQANDALIDDKCGKGLNNLPTVPDP